MLSNCVPHFKFHLAVEILSSLACRIVESFLLFTSFAMDSMPGQNPPPPEPPAEVSPIPPSGAVASITASISRQASQPMALHLEADRSRDANPKTKDGRPKKSDAEKIESLQSRIDVINHSNNVVAAVKDFLIAYQNESHKSQLQPAINALEFASRKCKEQIDGARRDVDNTSVKRQATQVHNKLTKKAKLAAQEKVAIGQAYAKEDPKKILSVSLKLAKEAVKAIETKSGSIASIVPTGSDTLDPGPLLPRKRKSAESEPIQSSAGDKAVHNIRLPRPANAALVYRPQEAVDIVHEMMNAQPTRSYRRAFKEKMIADRKVPVKMTRLNNMIRDHAPGKPRASVFWNTRGPQEIMPIEDLRAKYDEKTKRVGAGWSMDDTKAALFERRKANAVDNNIDASLVKEPIRHTVLAYHCALMSMPDIVVRACAPKTAYREAAETSQRSMLANAAGIIASRHIVIPNAETIPEHLRFNEDIF